MSDEKNSAIRHWTLWDGSQPQMAWPLSMPDGRYGLQGVIKDGPEAGAWQVKCSPAGLTEAVQINRLDGKMLHLSRGEKGWRVNHVLRRDLDACTDADLSASPATNTLPIRRLRLEIGEAAEITALFCDLETMTVRPARQRYTRIAMNRWRYEGLASGFETELDVDAEGWVGDYPGVFRAVGAQ